MKYNLVDYFDVWFNAEVGYFVNDIVRTDIIIDITENDSDDDIINKLIEVGYLSHEAIGQVVVERFDEYMIEVFTLDGAEPLCGLEKVD